MGANQIGAAKAITDHEGLVLLMIAPTVTHPMVITGRDLIADSAEEILRQSSIVKDLAVYVAVEQGGSTNDDVGGGGGGGDACEGHVEGPDGRTEEEGSGGARGTGTVWWWDFRRGATAGLKAAGGAHSFDKIVKTFGQGRSRPADDGPRRLAPRALLLSPGGNVLINREGNVITMPELATAARAHYGNNA